ncbi:hypothetical protein [Stenotrophomonas maltophilia]|uniref:hypothetical protein n=1 Tax=Stenotrophomonas maltophilia TaxID=40324 RepID=UPI0013DA215D|nr:hypothetical protein [Stenotrophomonas maltophilia]
MNIVRPTVASDAVLLARNLRDQDRREIVALTDESMTSVVETSVAASDKCYTWTNEGRVVAIFGVAATDIPEIGCTWMLATDELVTEKDFMFSFGTQFVDEFNSMYPVLENYILPDNYVCLKWLERMGFVFDEPEPFGPHGVPFVRFTRILPCA